jgi:hypothetical protein
MRRRRLLRAVNGLLLAEARATARMTKFIHSAAYAIVRPHLDPLSRWAVELNLETYSYGMDTALMVMERHQNHYLMRSRCNIDMLKAAIECHKDGTFLQYMTDMEYMRERVLQV